MKNILACAIAITAIGVLGSWWAMNARAATRDVSVADNTFVDAVSGNSTSTITAGDTVIWTWSGSNPHTVSSTGSESFDSAAPQTSGTYSHVFNTVGTFTYICGVHGASMSGTIVVQAAQVPTNTPQPTNTPAAPTNTPSSGATSTPVTTAAVPTGTPLSGSPVSASATPGGSSPPPSGTQAGGGALPTTGTGPDSGDGLSWSLVAALAAFAGLTLAGAAAVGVFRRSDH